MLNAILLTLSLGLLSAELPLIGYPLLCLSTASTIHKHVQNIEDIFSLSNCHNSDTLESMCGFSCVFGTMIVVLQSNNIDILIQGCIQLIRPIVHDNLVVRFWMYCISNVAITEIVIFLTTIATYMAIHYLISYSINN